MPCDGIPSTPYSLMCKNSQIEHGGAINRCALAAMRGRTFTFFVPRRTFSRKKFGASKISGTAGGQTRKGQKVKVFIYNKL